MQKQHLNDINVFFNEKYKKYGGSTNSLGWSQASQETRFEFFSKITDLKDRSILDVGAGFGDLGKYLKDREPTIKYTGYEINENFIFEAKKNNLALVNHNIFTQAPSEKFQIIFSIGMLNVFSVDNIESMKEMIKILFRSCTEVLAISMTSVYIDEQYHDDHIFLYDPCEIFTYAKTLSKNVSLHHNYLPHDFTIVLYKN